MFLFEFLKRNKTDTHTHTEANSECGHHDTNSYTYSLCATINMELYLL